MTVYALSSSAEPAHVRYVGATTRTLEIRLRTLTDSRRQCPLKDWMNATVENGHKVLIRPLSHHNKLMAMAKAEIRWIKKMRSVGWQLFNVKMKPDQPAQWYARTNGKHGTPKTSLEFA